MPKRIQRKRERGWRMPEGAVYVGRPSPWGNPFRIVVNVRYGPLVQDATRNFYPRSLRSARRFAVLAFRRWMRTPFARHLIDLAPLRGKDLACWCALVDKDGRPVPCHADVLLELANR